MEFTITLADGHVLKLEAPAGTTITGANVPIPPLPASDWQSQDIGYDGANLCRQAKIRVSGVAQGQPLELIDGKPDTFCLTTNTGRPRIDIVFNKPALIRGFGFTEIQGNPGASGYCKWYLSSYDITGKSIAELEANIPSWHNEGYVSTPYNRATVRPMIQSIVIVGDDVNARLGFSDIRTFA